MVRTVRPKATETPSSPIPTPGNAAASTALPQPPRTSQKVPTNSAARRLESGSIRSSPWLICRRLEQFEPRVVIGPRSHAGNLVVKFTDGRTVELGVAAGGELPVEGERLRKHRRRRLELPGPFGHHLEILQELAHVAARSEVALHHPWPIGFHEVA